MRREIITRRSLPHWYKPGAMFFLTYRLAGSLPQEVIDRLRASRDLFMKQAPQCAESAQQRERAHKKWFREFDASLDCANGVRWLADRRVAAIIRQNLYHHHGTKYFLLAYCILPNHVHVVLQPTEEFERKAFEDIGERTDGTSPLSSILHSLKSYTAHEANKVLRREGSFWQSESYDHWIRDENELERIVEYVQANPVEAKLSCRPEDYYWCSCHDRMLADGEVTAWLSWK